jgi:exodeoxyribonuclease V alpha subunit
MSLVRITAIYQSNSKQVNFSAVKVDENGNRIDGRTVVYIRTNPAHICLEPALGQVWRISGSSVLSEKPHDSYVVRTETYQLPKLEAILPSSNESFVRFISEQSDFKGIGESKARELWNVFGARIFEICENKDVAALTPYLTKKSIEGLLRGFERYSNLKYTTWLTEKEIPLPIQRRLIKVHKDESIQQIKDNPYHLVTMGLSFIEADAIAQKHFCYNQDSDNRLAAAMESALKQHSSNGHTVANKADLRRHLESLLGAYSGRVEKAFEVGANKLSYLRQGGNYHLTSSLIMEKVIAKRLSSLGRQTDTWTQEHQNALSLKLAELPYNLTQEQLDAINSVMVSHVSAIVGGAGTGKTTVIRTALRAYNEMGYTIIPCALSGRAAKRMHESIGFITTTIARLLQKTPVEEETMSLLVIDEAGMIDVPTMYQLVKHLHPSVRILFVGDANQLPPIGVGAILNDVIKSQTIPVSELTIVQRQSAESGVPDYANAIKGGAMPENLSVGCIAYHNETTEDAIKSKCVELLCKSSGDVMLIAPTKKLVQELNEVAQAQLNANAEHLMLTQYEQKYRTDFRLNDPIIFTKNNYSVGVQNGSLGKLVSTEDWGSVELEDGSVLKLDQTLFETIELAYAITLHKAQGSQFKTVIVALPLNSRMLNRAWLYTAVTRVESELHIVGSEPTMAEAIKRPSPALSRKTALSEFLVGKF